MFFTIKLHFITLNQILTYRKPHLPLTSSIYLVFLPLEMKGRLEQTKVYHTFFLLCLKRNKPQTFKSGSCKNLFLEYVCYWYNLLWWMFFILCDNWKTFLFIIVYCYSEIVLTAMLLLSLKTVFWRKSVFYVIPKFQNKAPYAS